MISDKYTGKTIVVALTYYGSDGKYIDQKQFHGEIIRFDPENGIEVTNRETNEAHTLPPRSNALFPAPPGEYVERTTGNMIHNPDFISIWQVTELPNSPDKWEWRAVKVESNTWADQNSQTRV